MPEITLTHVGDYSKSRNHWLWHDYIIKLQIQSRTEIDVLKMKSFAGAVSVSFVVRKGVRTKHLKELFS